MLTGLLGVGESVANKLIEYFGNEQAAFEALIEGNISAISQVDGITLKRAVTKICYRRRREVSLNNRG